jgi:hypothetical protein
VLDRRPNDVALGLRVSFPSHSAWMSSAQLQLASSIRTTGIVSAPRQLYILQILDRRCTCPRAKQRATHASHRHQSQSPHPSTCARRLLSSSTTPRARGRPARQCTCVSADGPDGITASSTAEASRCQAFVAVTIAPHPISPPLPYP